jgi:tetratricopeptide (TPR) repeat protein
MYALMLTFVPMFFFPIKTRYLMGLTPFVIVFSAYAVTQFYNMYTEKRFKALGLNMFMFGVLIVLSAWNPLKLTLPDVSETFYAIGKNFDGRQNALMAERYYTAAIQIDPQNISAYNELGVLYMNRKNYDRAVEYFKKAISLDPEAAYPRLNLELCQKASARL